MSGSRLREAAKVLRDAVSDATAGPWKAEDGGRVSAGYISGGPRRGQLRLVVEDIYGDSYAGQPATSDDATYIALMAPPVALALADWLDAEAWHQDRWLSALEEVTEPMWVFQGDTFSEALTLANAILGGTA